jgi:hypothetical protein
MLLSLAWQACLADILKRFVILLRRTCHDFPPGGSRPRYAGHNRPTIDEGDPTMFRYLIAAALIAATGCAPGQPAMAGEQPNLLVMGEDADTDTVPRGSRVFDRVLNALSEEMSMEGFRVYDETAVTMNITNPDRVRRDDAELISVARRVPDVPIDAVTVFKIYASAEDNAYADLTDLRMRVTGRILNVNSGQRLGNFEISYKRGDLPPLPANCNRECVLQNVGDQAARVGADLGRVLATKLDMISPAGTGTSEASAGVGINTSTAQSCTGLTEAYTLRFKGFESEEITRIEEYLVAFKGYDHHRPVRTDASQTDYWYETCSDVARLNRNLRLMGEHMALETRVAKTGNRFEITKIRGPKDR